MWDMHRPTTNGHTCSLFIQQGIYSTVLSTLRHTKYDELLFHWPEYQENAFYVVSYACCECRRMLQSTIICPMSLMRAQNISNLSGAIARAMHILQDHISALGLMTTPGNISYNIFSWNKIYLCSIYIE